MNNGTSTLSYRWKRCLVRTEGRYRSLDDFAFSIEVKNVSALPT